MSVKDLQRIEVLTEDLGGRRTAGSAAAVLGLSVRQMYRLLVRYGRGRGNVGDASSFGVFHGAV